MLLSVGAFAVFKATYTPSHERRLDDAINDIVIELPEEKEEVIEPVKTEEELWQACLEDSDRVNVLLFGTDGYRADTLILVSYSKSEQDVVMLTVPRDTKHEVEGMIYQGQDKINAVFCFPGDKGGADNQRQAIEDILGVPIHYYVKVNYYGLIAIVDTLGGIEVNVPFNMNYDDSYAKPELHIHLNQGTQTLSGNQAMGYIRWRKNNDGTGDSDIARTQRQQEFIVKVVKKSFGLNITKVIGICYDYVKTDLTKEDLLFFGSELIGFDFNNIRKFSLPGEADNRYFYQDVELTEAMMKEIYSFEKATEE
jgi:LCP family protein required for cell wall assembly